MTRRIETRRDLSSRVSRLAAKLQEHYRLDEPPALAFFESDGVLEVPDNLKDIESVIENIDLDTPTENWQRRAVELLDKDKLTPKEDDELKHLHRKMFRETLRNGLD